CVVRALPAPEPPTRSFHGGQRPNTVVFDLEGVLWRVERLGRHRQHRLNLRQHYAVLRARLRGGFSAAFAAVFLPFCPSTLCFSASNSDRIVRGGAVASTGCPASLASIKVFSSCAD